MNSGVSKPSGGSPLQMRKARQIPSKVPALLGLFCAFRPIVGPSQSLDDGSRMEPSTREASANFGGMTDRRGTSRFPLQEESGISNAIEDCENQRHWQDAELRVVEEFCSPPTGSCRWGAL